jgi:hypothetical protein
MPLASTICSWKQASKAADAATAAAAASNFIMECCHQIRVSIMRAACAHPYVSWRQPSTAHQRQHIVDGLCRSSRRNTHKAYAK